MAQTKFVALSQLTEFFSPQNGHHCFHCSWQLTTITTSACLFTSSIEQLEALQNQVSKKNLPFLKAFHDNFTLTIEQLFRTFGRLSGALLDIGARIRPRKPTEGMADSSDFIIAREVQRRDRRSCQRTTRFVD
jgi:hypothetical protein